MLKNIIALSIFVSINAFAYELPVDGKGGYIDECNNYANTKSDVFIKEHNIKFKPYSLRLGEKITEDKGWNETNFKTSLSAVCAMSSMQAKIVDESKAIRNGLSFYDGMYQSMNGDAPGDDLISLIKSTVIFGRKVN